LSLADSSNKIIRFSFSSESNTSNIDKIMNNSGVTESVNDASPSLEHVNMTISDVYNLAREFVKGSKLMTAHLKIKF